MKIKKWELNVTDNPNKIASTESDTFYTTDTEAFLIFELKDEGLNPITAELTLSNKSDGSIIHETVPVVDKFIHWEMFGDAIVHGGNWQAQLVYQQLKEGIPENYTSPVVQFGIEGHLLDEAQPTLIAIENWTTFTNAANTLVSEWTTYINDLKASVDAGEFDGADGNVVFDELTSAQIDMIRGLQGDQGERGESITYEWGSPTQLGVKTESEAGYDYHDLEGPQGKSANIVWRGKELGASVGDDPLIYVDLEGQQGIQGIEGEKGDSVYFTWDGTQLGLRSENDIDYTYVDLKGDQGVEGPKGDDGDKGDKGEIGDNLEFIWNGSQLGVRVEGEVNYAYVDLRGPQGNQGEQGEQGEPGSISGLMTTHIENALGYIPFPPQGGQLGSYSEMVSKPSTLVETTINLNLAAAFEIEPSRSSTISIINPTTALDMAQSFTLIIKNGVEAYPLTFPGTIVWRDGEIPLLDKLSTTYILTFISTDNGMTWWGSLGGEF